MECTENWDDDVEEKQNNDVPDKETVQNVEVIPGYTSFDDYLRETYDAIREGIRAANNIPSGENYNYYSRFPSFKNSKHENINKLVQMMQKIVDVGGISVNIARRDIEGRFDLLQETNDVFLDKANLCMDEECGIAKKPEIELVVSQTKKKSVTGSWNTVPLVSNSQQAHKEQAVRLLAARNIQRPQLTFKDKIDNSSKPWEPKLKDKPNSLKPLAIYLEEGPDGEEVFCHPYEFELDKFQPSEKQLKRKEPVKYKPLEETPLVMISKSSQIKDLIEDLKKYQEIAIDLEHHSYRSFQGITCLMQISTGDTDYVVDTLELRSELHELNEVFTKPTILKVFHGADSDIKWLQRDMSLYIVNMFDTHQAAKQLNLPYLSLAYLLKKYCGIDPNKHFQLADWRMRPLPDELLKYAREDTHYLLYIKDILRNALIDAAHGKNNILKSVYDRSTEVCKLTYIKPVWKEDSYLNMYRKTQKMFNNKQLYALKELHKWRDVTARIEDDSISYVLPNHMLLNIAETLPREMQGILACCNPIPPLVRQNLLKLHKIILKAREQPLIKAVLEDDIRQRVTQANDAENSEAWSYAPHDIPAGTEPRADLPCLLDQVEKVDESDVDVNHCVTVFDNSLSLKVFSVLDDGTVAFEENQQKKKFQFVSPFERYRRVLPMLAEQEAKAREKEEDEEQERLQKLKQEEDETVQSINKVHEHFKAVATNVSEEALRQKKNSQQNKTRVSLKHLPGRKRKRDVSESSVKEEPQEDTNHTLSTPVPSLNDKIRQGVKKESNDNNDKKEEREIQKTLELIQYKKSNDEDNIKPIRQRKKGEKKTNATELKKQGMLPMEKFDYKSVDFSSFQGGSAVKDATKQATFQQNVVKTKNKMKKRKKQKLSI